MCWLIAMLKRLPLSVRAFKASCNSKCYCWSVQSLGRASMTFLLTGHGSLLPGTLPGLGSGLSRLTISIQRSAIPILVVTATWATEPFLHTDMIRPGTHITTLGADQPSKAELSADLLRSSLFVCDDRDLA